MHGAFIVGINEVVINKFGKEIWLEILEEAGFEPNYHPISSQELSDEEAICLIKSTTKILNLGDKKFGEVFGDYWIKNYAKEKYFAFLSAFKNVKDFLLQINEIHSSLTDNLKNRKPPKFEIQWENTQSAIINYQSNRRLIYIAIGALKALGEFYHDEISIYKIDTDKIMVRFN